MNLEHINLVMYAKTYGLLYLIGMFLAVIVYACWPANKAKFISAGKSVLDEEDKPCQ